jgi:hypothetical protein
LSGGKQKRCETEWHCSGFKRLSSLLAAVAV